MRWKRHSDLEGRHAFLGASNYHWVNYSPKKLKTVYKNRLAKERGTEYHRFAADCVRLNMDLPQETKTINLYVNDVLKYKMRTEQPLYYSENAFGTADAIGYEGNILRIFDLKTGDTKTSAYQLLIYAALFCLEYGVDPRKIALIDLRIYQNNRVHGYTPDTRDILKIMGKIVEFDRIIDEEMCMEV